MDSSQTESPLGEPAPKGGTRERRIHQRIDCWGTCWISILPDGIKFLGYPLNLSVGGCYFETDAELPAQVGVNVDVHLSVCGSTLRFAGTILHIEEKTRAGIEFTQISSRKAEQIQQLTAKLLACEKERLAGIKTLCKLSLKNV